MGTNALIYAGIGSRETPAHILRSMYELARQLAPNWTMRSGFAEGADMAFCQGADAAQGDMEIFIPWTGFNNAPQDHPAIIVPSWTDAHFNLAQQYHPAWSKCSGGVRKLMARNGCQVLGHQLDSPAHMVICWTPGGMGGGGTGQALRIAEANEIPIFDLAISGTDRKLCEYVGMMESLALGGWEALAESSNPTNTRILEGV